MESGSCRLISYIIIAYNTIYASLWQHQPCLKHTIETAHQLSSQTPRHSEPLALDDSDMAQVPEKVLSWLYSVLHVRQNPPT